MLKRLKLGESGLTESLQFPPQLPERLVDAAAVGVRFGVSADVVKSLAESSKIPFVLFGSGRKRLRFRMSELDGYANEFHTYTPKRVVRHPSTYYTTDRHKHSHRCPRELYLALLEKQNGRCAICRRIPDRHGSRLCVDHDHATGEIRGLLCPTCNRVLGMMGDSASRLRAAANYLTGKRHDGSLHPRKRRMLEIVA